MAEPPASVRFDVVGSGRDVLLTTKLHEPRAQPGFVPRPRLVERLEEGLARGLILVCAPAGFGKTTLLADWARRGGRSVAWLSLDAGDNDPARFWRHVAAALDRARPGIVERVTPLLGPPAPPSFEWLVTVLINELATPQDEVVLVLDDYHLIDSPPVHASLAFLLEHQPPGLQVVLASRSDPPLPLARRRGRGQLAELRAAELRFTAEEAAALLREAVGPTLPLPDAILAALATRTEGWAAGLQLAGLSLRSQADVAGFVATFSGSHRYVLDYLTEEVLERQPERLREFLLETSVLDRLSGALCDAVTGRTDSQAMLETIERANLFLVPLHEVRGWWRYHHLFAGLLRLPPRARIPGPGPGAARRAHPRQGAPAAGAAARPSGGPRTRGRVGSAIEILALRALALQASGDEHGALAALAEALALAALAEALALAAPEGYLRVFVDEGAPMAALLGRLVAAQRRDRSAARGVPLEYLGRLARAFEQDAARSAPRAALHARPSAVIEPLSERELEVLRLLAAGKQNREIADELSVALDTVKRHVTHILVKLGAGNRTEATARARELGLLS